MSVEIFYAPTRCGKDGEDQIVHSRAILDESATEPTGRFLKSLVQTCVEGAQKSVQGRAILDDQTVEVSADCLYFPPKGDAEGGEEGGEVDAGRDEGRDEGPTGAGGDGCCRVPSVGGEGEEPTRHGRAILDDCKNNIGG